MLLFLIITTYELKLSIDNGVTPNGISALAAAYPIDKVFIVFCTAINFCVLTYFVKVIAEKREKNKVTLISIIFDGTLFAFLFLLAKDVILAGEILANPVMLGALAVSAVILLLDFLSMPLERWG